MARSMNWTRRRHETAAAVPVLALFAALYAWAVPTEGPNRWADMFWLAVLFAMPTLLWLFTSWLVVFDLWEGDGTRLSTMDAPAQVLAAVVATLPEPRQRWGQAMLGELAQVERRPARWRFALSCARAAFFLPLPARRLVLAIVTGAVVVAAVPATHVAVSEALPGLDVFAASFVALAGAVTVLAIARARSVRLPAPAATVAVTGAVAAAIAATATFLHLHPAAAEGLPPDRAAVLAAVLAGCLWLAVTPPHRLGSSRLAAHLGAGAAGVFALAALGAVIFELKALSAVLLFFGPPLTFGFVALVAALVGRSFRAGVRAGVWTAITVTPLCLAVGLVGSMREHATTGGWTFAGDSATAAFSLGFTFIAFLATPLVGFPFAVFGATVGKHARSTSPAAG
jgi:hypothetical protein